MGKGNNAPPDSAVKKAQMYPGLIKPLDRAIQDANSVYKSGYTTVGPNDLQTGAVGQLQGMLGKFGPNSQGSIDFASRIGAGGAMGAPGQNFLQSVYGGGNANPTAGAWGNLLGQAQQGSGGLDAIRATAGGAGLDVQNNPMLQRQIASSNADITRDYTNATVPGIEGRFASTGTAGSPMEGWAQQDAGRALADRLSSNTNNLMMGQYNQERGYQNQAQQALPGAWSGEIGTGIGAAQGMGSNYLSDLNTRLGAAQAAGSGYRSDISTALGAGQGMGGMYAGMTAPLSQAYGIGQQYQQAQQASANPQWAQLQQYLGLLGQAGGMANPQAAATQLAGYQSSGQQTFGNMLALGGLGASIFSDERLKKDIEPAGLGSGLYRWRYQWEGGDTPRHLGPMAQDVAEVAPSMVRQLDGLLTIPAVLVER